MYSTISRMTGWIIRKCKDAPSIWVDSQSNATTWVRTHQRASYYPSIENIAEDARPSIQDQCESASVFGHLQIVTPTMSLQSLKKIPKILTELLCSQYQVSPTVILLLPHSAAASFLGQLVPKLNQVWIVIHLMLLWSSNKIQDILFTHNIHKMKCYLLSPFPLLYWVVLFIGAIFLKISAVLGLHPFKGHTKFEKKNPSNVFWVIASHTKVSEVAAMVVAADWCYNISWR